jgi:hypothetical protein
VNLSIGYYYEHTKFEHLSTVELIETIKKVRLILNNVKNNPKMKPYPNKTVKKLWNWAREDDADFCFKCKVAHPLYNMMPVKVNGITREFCTDCYYETFVFCDVCGKLMVRVPDSEYNICPKCKRGE